MFKILVLLSLLLILSPAFAMDSLGLFEKDDCVMLTQTCSNCTYVNISSVQDPNSAIIKSNLAMTKTGTFYNYSFCNTSDVGTYIVSGFGDNDNAPDVFVYSFDITPNGLKPASDILTIGIYLLFLIATLGLFATFFINLAKLATLETNLVDVLLSISAFILMIVVVYLSENFLMDSFVQTLANGFVTYTKYTNVILPIISFVLGLIVFAFTKKRNKSVRELSGRLS